MTERRGGQPGPQAPRPEPGGGQPASRVIRGAELEHLKASRPEMANSRFALKWTDEQGRSHLGYNYRQATVGRDGVSRVDFYYDAPPTFESTYEGWRVGTAYEPGHYGKRPIGDLYTMLLRKDELGRSALDQFLTEADEAGYDVARWFSGRRDQAGLRAISQDDSPVQAMTFLLRKRPEDEDVTDRKP